MVEEQRKRGKGGILLALGALGVGVLALAQSVKAQPSECQGGRTEERLSDTSCGINNRGRIRQTREILCVNGQEAVLEWEYQDCVDSDVCVDGDRRCNEGNLEFCNAGQWLAVESCRQTQDCFPGAIDPFIITRDCNPATLSCEETGEQCREALPFDNCSCFSIQNNILKSEEIGDPLILITNVMNGCDFPLMVRVRVREIVGANGPQFNLLTDISQEITVNVGGSTIIARFPSMKRLGGQITTLEFNFEILTTEGFFISCIFFDMNLNPFP